MPGLYVAGEAAGGIHGRNRLMGNSLLDILVFGRRAGRHAAEQVAAHSHASLAGAKPSLSLDHAIRYNAEAKAAGVPPERRAPMLLPDYRPEPFKGHFTFFECR